MKITDIFDSVISNKESFEKIEEIQKNLKFFEEKINSLERNADIEYIFKDGKIKKENIYVKFLNKEIEKVNLSILASSFKNFLSPNKSAERTLKKWTEYLRAKEVDTTDIKSYLKIGDIDREVFYHEIMKEEKEILGSREYYVSAVINPSFKVLSYISTFDFIDSCSIKIVRSDIIGEDSFLHNQFSKNDYIHSKILDDEKNEKIIIEGPLKKFYSSLKKDNSINIKVKIKFNDSISKIQESKVLYFLEKEGIIVSTEKEEFEVTCLTVNSFELFALMLQQ